ncbi:hypothetical protein Hanom_Chr01g00069191 [Helianthus anomalus]
MNTVGLHLAIKMFHLKLVQKIDPIWSNITSKLINQSYSKTLWFSSPRCPRLRLLNHNSLCGQNHSCNRSCILQTTSGHLCWINHTRLHQILILVCHRIVTHLPFALLYFLHHHFTFNSRVLSY